MKATYYPPNSRVVVLLTGDPYTGQRGHVTSTRNVAGDMEHRVRFTDGATAVTTPTNCSGQKAAQAENRGRGQKLRAASPAEVAQIFHQLVSKERRPHGLRTSP
jgi:hypothetical protein